MHCVKQNNAHDLLFWVANYMQSFEITKLNLLEWIRDGKLDIIFAVPHSTSLWLNFVCCTTFWKFQALYLVLVILNIKNQT